MRTLNSSKRLLVDYPGYGIFRNGKLAGKCVHATWDPSGVSKGIMLRMVDIDPSVLDVTVMSFDVIAHEIQGTYRVFRDCWASSYTGIVIDDGLISIGLITGNFCSTEERDAH